MNAPVVVVGEFMEEPALAPLQEAYALLYDPSLVDDRARLLQTLPHARALIVRNRTRVDAELLAVAPRLQVVGRLGVGLDNIDLKACRERNIGVYPATGANAVAVAEYVIAAALILRRGAFHANAAVVAGQWPRNSLVGGELAGQTLGLWGFGDIARRVAARARARGLPGVAPPPYLA
ncbi:MAG: NAD(P)-dependent oxidoreductase, partial [Candidatus Competibacterales bacterium]